jgi:hypothetical protein
MFRPQLSAIFRKQQLITQYYAKFGNKYLSALYIGVWNIDIKFVFVFIQSYVTRRRHLTYVMWKGTCKLRAIEATLILGTD